MKNNLLSLDEIRQILNLLQENDVQEFSLNRGEETIRIKRGQSIIKSVSADTDISAGYVVDLKSKTHTSANRSSGNLSNENLEQAQRTLVQNRELSLPTDESSLPLEKTSERRSEKIKIKLHEIKSPMVGTFFKRPAPEAKPYVSVGDTVKKGQVLCLIEAMKVMNEIEADISGRIVEICLDDGQVVEFEELLYRIAPE